MDDIRNQALKETAESWIDAIHEFWENKEIKLLNYSRLEPFVGYKGISKEEFEPQIKFEDDFVAVLRDAVFEPSLFSTYTAYKTLQLPIVQKKDFFKGKEQELVGFIKKQYDPSRGAFYNHFLTLKPPAERCSLKATSWGLNLLGLISGIPLSKSVGRLNIVKYLGKKSDKTILEFTRSCFRNNGFIDSPEENFQPTLSAISAALKILFNLGNDKFLSENRMGIKSFIMDCFAEKEGGFSYTPGSSPSLCATRFALSLLKLIEEEKGIATITSQVSNFLNLCKKAGGFSTTPDSLPNTISINFALDIYESLNLDIKTNLIREVIQFVKNCYVQDEGFSLTPGFPPNLLGNENAAQISYWLYKHYPQLANKLPYNRIGEFVIKNHYLGEGKFSYQVLSKFVDGTQARFGARSVPLTLGFEPPKQSEEKMKDKLKKSLDEYFWNYLDKKGYDTYFKDIDKLKKKYPPETVLGFVDGKLEATGQNREEVWKQIRGRFKRIPTTRCYVTGINVADMRIKA